MFPELQAVFPIPAFWDDELVSLALSLPTGWKLRRKTTKYVLRKANAWYDRLGAGMKHPEYKKRKQALVRIDDQMQQMFQDFKKPTRWLRQ